MPRMWKEVPNDNKTRQKASQTTLRFAFHSSLQNEIPLQSMLDAFAQANPGVHIQAMPTAFPLEYANHGMADVITLSTWDALKRSAGEQSSYPFVPMDHLEGAHPKLYESFVEPGLEMRRIAAPFVFSPIVLCYNKEHFQQCHLPAPDEHWTWYTLLKASLTVSRQLDTWGFATHMQSINRWPVFLLQNEFRFQADNPTWRAADDPVFWESLRVARDLIHLQKRPMALWTESNSDAEKLFLEGKASMILTTYFGMNRLLASKIKYGVAPLPSLSNANTLLLTTGLSVLQSSPQQELALRFVDFLCSHENQALIRRQTLTLPAEKHALAIQDGLIGNRPLHEKIYEQLWDNCRTYTDLKLDVRTLEAIREELKAYWSRLEDEAEASERIETLLK